MGKARDKRLKWLARKGLPSGEFWLVSNYGWGDGGCDGPYSAYQALVKLYGQNTLWGDLDEFLQKGYTLKNIFKNHLDSSMIHYISDYDRSRDFDDYMSS